MIPDRHSRRFDPLWLFPIIGTDGAELYVAPEASPHPAAGASRDDPFGVQFDEALEQIVEALEQIVTDGCRACPICGLIAARSGSSLR